MPDYHETHADALTEEQISEIAAAKAAWEEAIAKHGSHSSARAKVIADVKAAWIARGGHRLQGVGS